MIHSLIRDFCALLTVHFFLHSCLNIFLLMELLEANSKQMCPDISACWELEPCLMGWLLPCPEGSLKEQAALPAISLHLGTRSIFGDGLCLGAEWG